MASILKPFFYNLMYSTRWDNDREGTNTDKKHEGVGRDLGFKGMGIRS